jgi:uncharacterized protein (DUF488 family)
MVEALQERTHMATLFTVGYEGSKPSDLFASLQDNGITLLIDVREVPISRKPGFSKTSLSLGLDVAGIRYLHLKGLGDPKPGRVAALGALGMLAFAILFSLMVESSTLVAFIGASLAWLVVSVVAWYVRRKMRSVRKARTAEKTGGSAVSRSRYG